MTKWPTPIPAWFWAWARWRLGRSEFKGHANDPALRPKAAPARIPAWAWARLAALVGAKPPKPAPAPAPRRELTMYDSIDVTQMPNGAEAVAGYVNGHWPTFKSLEGRFPRAHRLSIAVTAHVDAECLDVEEGDATPDQAPAWVKRQLARGIRRPVVYTSVSQAPALQAELAKAGVPRSHYRLWTAHYTFRAHRCTRACWPGFNDEADATQYHDRAMGRNLDASLCAPEFFDVA